MEQKFSVINVYNRFTQHEQLKEKTIYIGNQHGERVDDTFGVRYFCVYINNEERYREMSSCKLVTISKNLGMDINELEKVMKQYNAMTNQEGGNLFTSYADIKKFFEEFLVPYLIIIKLINKTPKVEMSF